MNPKRIVLYLAVLIAFIPRNGDSAVFTRGATLLQGRTTDDDFRIGPNSVAVESKQYETADEPWSDQNLIDEKKEESRSGELERRTHPCVKSSKRIVYGTNVYIEYECRRYSLTGCDLYRFHGKCVPVVTFYIDLGRTFTTDCVCVNSK